MRMTKIYVPKILTIFLLSMSIVSCAQKGFMASNHIGGSESLTEDEYNQRRKASIGDEVELQPVSEKSNDDKPIKILLGKAKIDTRKASTQIIFLDLKAQIDNQEFSQSYYGTIIEMEDSQESIVDFEEVRPNPESTINSGAAIDHPKMDTKLLSGKIKPVGMCVKDANNQCALLVINSFETATQKRLSQIALHPATTIGEEDTVPQGSEEENESEPDVGSTGELVGFNLNDLHTVIETASTFNPVVHDASLVPKKKLPIPKSGTTTLQLPPVLTTAPTDANDPNAPIAENTPEFTLDLNNPDLSQLASRDALPGEAVGYHARPKNHKELITAALRGGISLPESDEIYTKNKHSLNYYSTGLMRKFVQAVAQYSMSNVGYKLNIGDISKKGGGHLSPHSAHRTGLDVDIDYPSNGSKDRWNPNDLQKIRELMSVITFQIKTKIVGWVFVNTSIKKQLCSEFKNSTDPVIAEALVRIRGWKGHVEHFHTRLKCSSIYNSCGYDSDPVEAKLSNECN